MKTQVIRIGNSQGIRIPKILLEESGLGADVELEICPGGILIRNVVKPRSGWEAAFAVFSDMDDDLTLTQPVTSSFEKKEWQW
jgi:antitoxin MazE